MEPHLLRSGITVAKAGLCERPEQRGELLVLELRHVLESGRQQPAHDLPRIFGRAGFTLLLDPARLPRALPEIYQTLTMES